MLDHLDQDTMNHIAYMCGPTMEGFITQLRLKAVTRFIKLTLKITLPIFHAIDTGRQFCIDKHFTDVIDTDEVIMVYDIDHYRNPWQTLSNRFSHVTQLDSNLQYDPYSCKYLKRIGSWFLRSFHQASFEKINVKNLLPPVLYRKFKYNVHLRSKSRQKKIELLSSALNCVAREMPHNISIDSIIVDLPNDLTNTNIVDSIGRVVRMTNNLTEFCICDCWSLRPILSQFQNLKHLEICNWNGIELYDIGQLVLFISQGTLHTLKLFINMKFNNLRNDFGLLFWNSVRLSNHLTELVVNLSLLCKSTYTNQFIYQCTRHVDRFFTAERLPSSDNFLLRTCSFVGLNDAYPLNEREKLDIHEIQKRARIMCKLYPVVRLKFNDRQKRSTRRPVRLIQEV